MKCDELKPLVFSLHDLSFIDEPAVQKNFENPHDHAVYKATEVDAAIAELKEKLRDQCISCPVKEQEDDVVADLKRKLESVIAEKDKELRHHKYKRCLGMVRCCMVDNHTLGQVTLNERTNHLQWLFNENFFVKWAARWSKIADKFKEAK